MRSTDKELRILGDQNMLIFGGLKKLQEWPKGGMWFQTELYCRSLGQHGNLANLYTVQ
jgi:hypothetical protein